MVGVHLGVAKFATLVTNDKQTIQYESVRAYRRLEPLLAKEQRKLKRKVKFSENWKKQNRKIQKVHQKIVNSRKDYLHKVSTEISKNHAVIVLSDVKVKSVSKSARGTIENPGKDVKVKSIFNKAILDQGWYMFKRQLEYKSQWKGGEFLLVDHKNTSLACSSCGNRANDNKKTFKDFTCTGCGKKEKASY